MRLYEIDAAIAALADPETGEIMDYDAFMALSMARDQKIENMALLLKNKVALSEAIKKEVALLQARKKVADNAVERLKEYIAKALDGEKFESARCSISYRKSESTETDADFAEWATENCPDLVLPQEPKVDATELKKRLKGGMDCPYARIVEKRNVMVK